MFIQSPVEEQSGGFPSLVLTNQAGVCVRIQVSV